MACRGSAVRVRLAPFLDSFPSCFWLAGNCTRPRDRRQTLCPRRRQAAPQSCPLSLVLPPSETPQLPMEGRLQASHIREHSTLRAARAASRNSAPFGFTFNTHHPEAWQAKQLQLRNGLQPPDRQSMTRGCSSSIAAGWWNLCHLRKRQQPVPGLHRCGSPL
jgi:hypothetical protein